MLFVFDFDGVVVDSSGLFLEGLRELHAEMAVLQEIPDDLWDQLDDVSFPAILQHIGVPSELRGDYLQRLLARAAGDRYQPDLFDGIDRVLCELADHAPIAILSASPKEMIEKILERAGLSGTIAAICAGGTPGSKAEKLPALLGQFGVGPSQAVMIGDAVSDIRAGKANAMWTGAVSWGWQSAGRLAAERPHWLFERVDDLRTLPDLLEAR